MSKHLILLAIMASVNGSYFVSQICKSNKNNYEMCHQRLGQMSKNKLLELKKYKMIKDFN